ALLQSLHHLVAMHRALRQQFQQRVFQIPTAKKALAPARKTWILLAEGTTVAERATWAKRPTWTKGAARAKEPPPHVQAEERPLVPAMPPPAAPLVPAAAPPRPVISVSALVLICPSSAEHMCLLIRSIDTDISLSCVDYNDISVSCQYP